MSGGWLLFGLFAAGLIHEMINPKFVAKQLHRPGLGSILKASLFGLPLPLCSCSVIPVGVSLRKSGASKGATASFFVSTPEIGADSFLLSYVLLGPLLAVLRVIASFLSAMLAGIGIDYALPDAEAEEPRADSGESEVASQSHSCCGGAPKKVGLLSHLRSALHYGFVELLDDIARLLLIGFAVAALITAIVPPESFSNLDLGPIGYSVALLLLSLPMYVCSTASTPIAAALLAKGVPPGAVLVFLLAGPATNVSTILVLRRELGVRATSLYLASVVGVAFLIALALDSFSKAAGGTKAVSALAANHVHGGSLVQNVFGAALLLLLALSVLRSYRKKATKDCCHAEPKNSSAA